VQAGSSGFNAGVADIAGIPMDTATNVSNLLKSGVEAGMLGMDIIPPTWLDPDKPENVPGTSEWIKKHVRSAGGAGLIDTSTILNGWAAEKHAWLRRVAHRDGMDYLTDVPPEITRPIPNSLESFSERAQQITSVLNEILRKPIHPPSLP